MLLFSHSYFVVQFVAPTVTVPKVKTSLKLDQDIIRCTLTQLKTKKPFECTLQDELKPPMYRSVKSIEIGLTFVQNGNLCWVSSGLLNGLLGIGWVVLFDKK